MGIKVHVESALLVYDSMRKSTEILSTNVIEENVTIRLKKRSIRCRARRPRLDALCAVRDLFFQLPDRDRRAPARLAG